MLQEATYISFRNAKNPIYIILLLLIAKSERKIISLGLYPKNMHFIIR